MPITRWLLLLAAGIAACRPPHPADLTAAEAADSLPPADTAAVLQLATQFGIQHPVQITNPFSHYVGCPYVIAVSPVTSDGDRRSRFELTVRRKGRDTGGHRCQMGDTDGAKVKRFGRWVASSTELSEKVRWRVHDGDWYVDVSLGDGVAFDTATVIIRAIRQRTLVNRIPKLFLGRTPDTLLVIDASDIRAIERSRDEANTFEVWTGERAGLVLDVSIVAGRVEVRNISSWIS